ncbi:hypothetical protein BDW59DRAFT_41551 [Aspergillus cavernicola]|uniref:Uncharacterized protein n=1 Tax=Aspergillus cavernicola TaxID=176166 RepID=A0ABR4HAU0_9EURO
MQIPAPHRCTVCWLRRATCSMVSQITRTACSVADWGTSVGASTSCGRSCWCTSYK